MAVAACVNACAAWDIDPMVGRQGRLCSTEHEGLNVPLGENTQNGLQTELWVNHPPPPHFMYLAACFCIMGS